MRKAVFFVALAVSSLLTSRLALGQVIPLKQEMPYIKARQALINSGWQAVYNGCWAKGCVNGEDQKIYAKEFLNRGFYEIWGCSGTGLNICRMFFRNANQKYLEVWLFGGSRPNPSAPIDGWRFVENPE